MLTVRGWDSPTKRTGCPFRGPRWLGSLLLPASSQQSLTPVPRNRGAVLDSMSTVCMRYTYTRAHKTPMHIKQISQNGGSTRITTKEQNEELGQLIFWFLKIRVTVACMGWISAKPWAPWLVGLSLSEEQSSGKYFSFFGRQGPLAVDHIQLSIVWIVHSVSLENPQVIVL